MYMIIVAANSDHTFNEVLSGTLKECKEFLEVQRYPDQYLLVKIIDFNVQREVVLTEEQT
jgi:hypothetical protein